MPSEESRTLRQKLYKPEEPDTRPFPIQRQEWENYVADDPLPNETSVTAQIINGVPCERITCGTVKNDVIMVYLHGGGFVMGSCITHRTMGAHLSRACGIPILMVDYRLAPEHRFPASIEDVFVVHQHLIQTDYQPEQVIFGGDSAGGGLVVSAMLKLRDQDILLPSAGILLSPWLDLALSGESMQTQKDNDPTLIESDLRYCATHYADESLWKDPMASPVYASLNNFPPLLIHVGEHEILASDSVRLNENAKAVGVDVDLKIWDEMWHTFHSFAPDLPEANQALAEIGLFVRDKLGLKAK